MKIGVPGVVVPPGEGVIKMAQGQEAAGFDSVWWPDHLMAWHPQSIWTEEFTPLAKRQPDPHVFLDTIACMTAAAVHTKRIRLGSSVTEPVRRHPAMLAQEFLSVDHFSAGRAILGIGTGEGENTMPYGIAIDRPASRLEEALEIIRLLWESEGPVDYDSQFWPHKDAVFGLGPIAAGQYPPIWVAAHGNRMLDIAGRLADGWLPMLMQPDDYGRRLDRIFDARARFGVDRPFEAGIWTYLCFGDSKDECLKMFENPVYSVLAMQLPASVFQEYGMEHPLGSGSYGLLDFIPSRYSRNEVLDMVEKIPPEIVGRAILHGSPDDVAADLHDLEAAGCQHAVLWNISFLTDLGRLKSSFEMQAHVLGEMRSPEPVPS